MIRLETLNGVRVDDVAVVSGKPVPADAPKAHGVMIAPKPVVEPAAVEIKPNFYQFEVGKVYYTRSACDHDCIYRFEVLSRTPSGKSVKIKDLADGKISSRRISVWSANREGFSPYGSYSMAPYVTADDFETGNEEWAR